MEINRIKKNLKVLAEQTLKGKQIITPFIQGIPGVGKSQIIKQIQQELGYDCVIDLRMSQHDDTDIKGIPSLHGDIFKWLSPEFIPVEGNEKYKDKKVILFFDELNRANQQTIQSVFEAVYDYKVGGKPFQKNTFVVCAGNLGFEDDTNVIEFDSALKNRLLLFTITEEDISYQEWIDNFALKNNINNYIIDFIRINPRFLYKKFEDCIVTPRSWEKLSKIMELVPEDNYIELLNDMGSGIIYSITQQFCSFIIDKMKDRKKMSPEQILKHKDLESYLCHIEREQLYTLVYEIAEYTKKIKKPSKTELNNFKVLINNISDDHKVALFTQSLNNGTVTNFIKAFLVEFSEFNDSESELNNILRRSLL